MKQAKLGAKGKLKETAVGFVLGAVGGCILGATEDPLDKIVSVMTTSSSLKPVVEEARTVGALGLGTLMGATALTTAMTSVIAGVILAAVITSVFAATGRCTGSHKHSVGLWASAGFAGAFGTTLSGVMLGSAIEWIVKKYSMVGLLWALSLFTILKPPMRFLFRILWKQGEVCCTLGSDARSLERENLEISDWQQRQRVTLQIEKRILSLEKGSSTSGMEDRTRWVTEQKEREQIERKRLKNEEAEMKQKTLHDWINTVMMKHVDFLAFSGVPMTIITMVTSGFGLFGYGNHQSVLIVLLALVSLMGYFLLQSSDFNFWMLLGCMGMFATFVIAMLTLHAGQVVVTTAMKLRVAGHNQSRETISAHMNYQSSLEAVKTAFFGAKLCQLGLGATVGGTLVRHSTGKVRVIAGAASVAGGLLVGMDVLSPVLGEGGAAGALLGVVGAAGVSVGATAAAAGRWSSWQGTLGTTVGLIIGALGMGKWHTVNIGLQLPVAYVFAMTKPF
ncbi:uncharacterized protein LOC121637987 [Melanotaenia boesemani]|uniref:uncharacterized protein LOC121637987 n=1 Tax=Melanotaenia boesemani TaxID=1250792 RepID=UPI001C057CFB|nr:uncharacterized protein LOC121637987 [Melanotaenia boesemani]